MITAIGIFLIVLALPPLLVPQNGMAISAPGAVVIAALILGGSGLIAAALFSH